MFLEQAIRLVSQSPDNLAYHILTLLSVQAAFAIALWQWRQNREDRFAGRIAVAAGSIFLLRVILVFVTASLDQSDFLPTLPPLERALDLATTLLLVWGFVSYARQLPRLNDVLLILGLLATVAVYVMAAQDWLLKLEFGLAYGDTNQAAAWAIAQFILLGSGIGLLLITRPADWALRGLALLPLLLAHLADWFALTPIPLDDLAVPISYWVRLAYLVCLPLLAVLAYRHNLSRLLAGQINTWPLEEQLPELLRVVGRVINPSDLDQTLVAAAAAAADIFNAHFAAAAILQQNDGADQLRVVSWQPLEEGGGRTLTWILNLTDWPAMQLALIQRRVVELLPNGLGARQLFALYRELGLPQLGALLVVPMFDAKDEETVLPRIEDLPMPAQDKARIGLLLLGGAIDRDRWSEEDKGLAPHAALYFARSIVAAQAFTRAVQRSRVADPLSDERVRRRLATLEQAREEALEQARAQELLLREAEAMLQDSENRLQQTETLLQQTEDKLRYTEKQLAQLQQGEEIDAATFNGRIAELERELGEANDLALAYAARLKEVETELARARRGEWSAPATADLEDDETAGDTLVDSGLTWAALLGQTDRPGQQAENVDRPEDLSERLKQIERERDDVTDQALALAERLKRVDGRLKEAESRVQIARNLLTQEQHRLSEAQNKLDEIQQRTLEDQTEILEEEVEALREALREAEEAMALASAGQGGLSTEWVMMTITRYSGELEEAQQRIQQLETRLANREEVYASDKMMTLIEELRTPLTAIVGYTDVLLSETNGILTNVQRDLLQRAKASTERMETLLSQIVGTARGDEDLTGGTHVEPVSVAETIEMAVNAVLPQIQEKELQLDLNIDPNLPSLGIEQDDLYQIVVYLLANACQATMPGGRVRLAAQLGRSKTQQAEEAFTFLRLTVTDSGIGIPAEERPHVFDEAYRRTHAVIPGLGDGGEGLSKAQTLVRIHGGRLWVDSETGIGSTFSVLLPLAENGSKAS